MKSKFFVGIPEFNIKTLMAFTGSITGRSLKTQEAYVRFINELFSAEDGGEVVKEGNISRQTRGEVSFTTRKGIEPAGELDIIQDISVTDSLQQLKEGFAALIRAEKTLAATENCFERYSAEKARQLFALIEKYSRIAQKLNTKKQQQILANLTLVVLSFFIYNGRDFCSDVEILYADPFVEKLREDNLKNRQGETRTIYPELYAKVNRNGQKLSLVQLIKATGSTPLYIKAEGGGGKTTSVLAAVNEMHMEDEAALYIDAKQLDTYEGAEKEYFLLNRIGNFFEKYTSGAETLTDRYNLVNTLLGQECRQLVVFIDGINETRDRQSLANQIRAVSKMDRVKTVITGRYFSSRIVSAVMPLQCELEQWEDMLQLVEKYCPAKAEKYKTLDEETLQLLKTPMFFALYCAGKDTDTHINAAQLLHSSLVRTLEQQKINYGSLAQFVLSDILPRFVACCCKNQPVMSFNRRQFADFVQHTDADADIYQCIEIIITSGIVRTADSRIFYFNHEIFRDFLWAYAVAEYQNREDSTQRENPLLYLPKGSFALKCFAQLCGKKQIRRLLGRRSSENISEESWHSEENAKLTAALMEAARILWDNRFGEAENDMFWGKNLSACDFRHCQIRDIAFEGSLVAENSFGVEGHTTAVWALEKYKNRIFALDKNSLTAYTPQLEKLQSVYFGGGQTFVSSARSRNMLCAVDRTGLARLFCLDTMQQTGTVAEYGCVQVISKNNGFVLGTGDGRLLICNDALAVEKTVEYPQFRGKSCIPVGYTAKAVIFGVKNILYRYNIKEETIAELCRFDLDITKGVYLNGTAAVAVSDGRGTTEIMVYNGEKPRRENTIVPKEEISAFLDSLNLNGAKINDIAVSEDSIAMVCNDGCCYLYTAEEGDIVLADIICLQNISAKNPSLTVESCTFADSSTLVCGFTDRSIKLVDISSTNREKGRTIRHIKGSNNGIRRLFATEYGTAACFYDRGGALFEKTARGLVLKDKFLLSDSDWVWSGIQWGENCIFAAGSFAVVYSPKQHRIISRINLKSKVEALFLSSEGYILAAAGPAVYRLGGGNYLQTELVVRDRHSRRALCFAEREDKLYIGFASTAGHSACLKVVENFAKVTDAEKYLEKTWNFSDGWYRSLAFSPDGQYLFCCGLKQQTEDGVKDVTAIYRAGKNQLKPVGVLSGHSKAVLSAIFAGEKLATCSDDGCINVYGFDGTESFDRNPQKTIKVSESQLFNMVQWQTDSVLACSLDGNIYKVNISDGSVQSLYTNLAGMYCTGCDFDGAVFADGKGAVL